MGKNYVKEMAKVFESYRYKHGVYTAFEDFLELAAIEISNPVDLLQKEKRNERYIEIVKKYSGKEFEGFGNLLGMLAMALESEPDDYLGRLFMELELFDHWKGQFFTPLDVATVIAKITFSDLDEKIKEKGFVTVNDPAVGGGVTLIAAFNEARVKGHNPQKTMQIVARDIDVKAVHMSYIQFSLLGINATIIHGNTLTMEIWDVWKSPGYFFRWGYGAPKVEQAENKDLEVLDKLPNLIVDEDEKQYNTFLKEVLGF